IMPEAAVLDGIGFTVPDSGESRLGRVPAQPARLRFSRKSSACTARGFAAAPDPTITKNGDRRAMAMGSGPTFEQKMDRLLAAAHDCGAWLRFRTVRPETTHSSASGDVAHDELILTLPDGRRERFNLGVGGIDRLVGAGVLRHCSPM